MVKTSDLVADLRTCLRGECSTCGHECGNADCLDRIMEDAADRLEELVDRCARYAEEIAMKLMRLADLESLCGYTRLRELAEADKDERVVALPVKPVLTPILSSMLYIIEDGDIYEDALYEAVVGMSESGKVNVVYTTLSDQIIFEQADIGKTVFLTREEARKALEAMRKGEVT